MSANLLFSSQSRKQFFVKKLSKLTKCHTKTTHWFLLDYKDISNYEIIARLVLIHTMESSFSVCDHKISLQINSLDYILNH